MNIPRIVDAIGYIDDDLSLIHIFTELGTEVLELELKRIRRLYRNAQEVTK